MPIISVLISTIGSAIGSFFNFKGDQARVVEKSLETLSTLNQTEGQSIIAQASAISAILTQGSFLERNWRAVAMCLIMVLIGAYFFGHTPSNINGIMPPIIGRLFDLFEIGLGGYIVRYGIRDMIREFNIATIIKSLINKKIL